MKRAMRPLGLRCREPIAGCNTVDALDLLLKRASLPPKLQEANGLDDAALVPLFAAAMSAPDHGLLRPWRLLVIRGERRRQLGDVFAEALRRRDPAADEHAIENERSKPMRSPVMIAVIARLTADNPKVPVIEQIISTALCGHHVVLAAEATGLGAIWLTGGAAYDRQVHAALGLEAGEQLLGFIYIGRPRRRTKGPRRPDWRIHVADWNGPAG